jgi:hypothetical protein
MTTYRERRLAKAERLRGWAEKRQATATAALESHPEMRHDWAFITQPGHIPARARMIAADGRAFESLRKAENMAARADGIEAAADGAIYSDDPDAIEALEARIAKLEAERDKIKARNAQYRKDHKDELKALTAYGRSQAMPYPAYVLTNLSGNIGRQRKRLEMLKRGQA